MILKYITKIRTKVNIYSSKKTSNLFDGSYKSIYQGNGLDFENLREYIPGDSIRDIDWKASSRSGKMLVKRYVAEKKHNIMVVWDTGKKMTAHTKDKTCKKELAMDAGGLIAYLAARNGDNVGAVYNRNGFIQYYQLRTGTHNVERVLAYFDKEKFDDYQADLEKSLEYVIKNVKRRMIVFVVTDAVGIRDVSETTLRRLVKRHDVLFISIGDADYTGDNIYNWDNDSYVPEFISRNKKLKTVEKEAKESLAASNTNKLTQHQIVSTQIDCDEEMVDKIVELLEGHRYANNR